MDIIDKVGDWSYAIISHGFVKLVVYSIMVVFLIMAIIYFSQKIMVSEDMSVYHAVARGGFDYVDFNKKRDDIDRLPQEVDNQAYTYY